MQAVNVAKRVGFLEGRIPLAHAVIDLCLSPKSKSGEFAIDAAMHTLRHTSYSVPSYLRLTPIHMKEENKYDYSRNDLWSKIQYLPNQLKDMQFYHSQTNSTYKKYWHKI